MSYFEDCYLKRINRAGETRQDRIEFEKEKEFEKIFMAQTQYKVNIYQLNDEPVKIVGSLQPNKWNESSLISNLLISKSVTPFHTGDLVYIKQKIKNKEQDKIWLVLFIEENLTKGYQLFKVICLDTFINITNEYGDTIVTLPVKFVNASQSFTEDTLIKTESEKGYREPQGNRIMIAKDCEELKKDTYFEYEDKGWEIVSKDDISISNVAYVYVSERLIRENEPSSSRDIPVGEDVNFFLNGRR